MYRSKLEEQVAQKLPRASYEPYSMPYTVRHNYTPDFVDGHKHYEVKGFFRPGDTQKYLAINEMMKINNLEFIFILQDPNKPVRKGTKLTMSKWCDKNFIKWISVDAIK